MLGVYVHIPFCNRICHYCDFCKILYTSKLVNEYLIVLEKEITERYKGEMINSLYIGGGTPSSLSLCELDKLLSILAIFKFKEKYEYTIECNIDDINSDKLKLFRQYGINRISFGVESFNKDIGNILGRNCDEKVIFDNINITKQYFDNINIDLIYGVSDNLDIVKSDIDKFLKLDIQHISCYALILEEHTKLYIDKYKNICDEIEYKMYKYILNTLVNNGYEHYEISNYAKKGYESIHNKNYWLNGNYYGFGLGAVSYLDNYRITNTKNMHKYLDSLYVQYNIYEDENIQKENDLILGFRMTHGVNVLNFNQKYNDDLLNRKIIKDLVNDKYLIYDGKNIKCNQKYFYIQNMILERILGSEL